MDFLTCQISAILSADRGDRRKSQSPHRAHSAIFADRRDRLIKSPGMSPALVSCTIFRVIFELLRWHFQKLKINYNSMRYHRLVKSFFDLTLKILLSIPPSLLDISFKLVRRINIYINIKTFQESDCIYSESYGFLHFHCILSVDQKLITLNQKCLFLNLIFSSVVSQVILYVYIVRSGNRRLRKNNSHFGG